MGPRKSVLIRERCPDYRGELIHISIALGQNKVSRCPDIRVSTYFRNSNCHVPWLRDVWIAWGRILMDVGDHAHHTGVEGGGGHARDYNLVIGGADVQSPQGSVEK